MNKIDPRQLRTKIKLHNAAISIFSKTTGEPTISEICQEAKITRPTFYNHYASVDELKEYLTNDLLDGMKKTLPVDSEVVFSSFDPSEMPKIFTELFSHIEKNFEFYNAFLVKRNEKSIHDGIFNILRNYINDGMSSVEPSHQYISPHELIVNYVSGAYFQCIIWWIKENKPYPAEEMYTHMIDLSLSGPYSNLITPK